MTMAVNIKLLVKEKYYLSILLNISFIAGDIYMAMALNLNVND